MSVKREEGGVGRCGRGELRSEGGSAGGDAVFKAASRQGA